MPTKQLSTVEAAARLGTTVRTVQRLVKSGELTPAVRFPGATGPMLFRPADVAKLAKARQKAKVSA